MENAAPARSPRFAPSDRSGNTSSPPRTNHTAPATPAYPAAPGPSPPPRQAQNLSAAWLPPYLAASPSDPPSSTPPSSAPVSASPPASPHCTASAQTAQNHRSSKKSPPRQPRSRALFPA